MITFKHKFNGAEVEYSNEDSAQRFASLAKKQKNLNHYEFISEKFKLNYKDGIISGKRYNRKNKATD